MELFQRSESHQRALFGAHALPAGWAPYVRQGAGAGIVVAEIPATNSEGIASTIEESRYPASFFRLVLHQVDLGRHGGIVELVVMTGTGSDLAKTIYQLAVMAACGALLFDLN